MSEDAPQIPDESQRIEDPEKARVMAEAGDETRTVAAALRNGAKYLEDPGYKRVEIRDANAEDAQADQIEEEAGRQYDTDQTRIQDPDKAETMAYAGDSYRTAAVDARRIADFKERGFGNDWQDRLQAAEYRQDAVAIDETADIAENKAGEQYDNDHTLDQNTEEDVQEASQQNDANQSATQIPVKEESDKPFPNRVEDVDKARAMATAGDQLRTSAVEHRIAAESPFFGGPGTEGEKSHTEQAVQADNQAAQLEESAGRYYDSWPAKQERLLNEHEQMLDEHFAALRHALEQGVGDDELDEIWKRLKSDGRLLHSMKVSWNRDQDSAP